MIALKMDDNCSVEIDNDDAFLDTCWKPKGEMSRDKPNVRKQKAQIIWFTRAQINRCEEAIGHMKCAVMGSNPSWNVKMFDFQHGQS